MQLQPTMPTQWPIIQTIAKLCPGNPRRKAKKFGIAENRNWSNKFLATKAFCLRIYVR